MSPKHKHNRANSSLWTQYMLKEVFPIRRYSKQILRSVQNDEELTNKFETKKRFEVKTNLTGK